MNYSFNLKIKKFIEPELQKFPDTPALHLLARDPNAKRKSSNISFNMKAMVEFIFNDGEEFSVAVDNDTSQICLFLNPAKKEVDCPIYKINKNNIIRSKEIYDYIVTKYNLNTDQDNYVHLEKNSIELIEGKGPITIFKLLELLTESTESIDEVLESALLHKEEKVEKV